MWVKKTYSIKWKCINLLRKPQTRLSHSFVALETLSSVNLIRMYLISVSHTKCMNFNKPVMFQNEKPTIRIKSALVFKIFNFYQTIKLSKLIKNALRQKSCHYWMAIVAFIKKQNLANLWNLWCRDLENYRYMLVYFPPKAAYILFNFLN